VTAYNTDNDDDDDDMIMTHTVTQQQQQHGNVLPGNYTLSSPPEKLSLRLINKFNIAHTHYAFSLTTQSHIATDEPTNKTDKTNVEENQTGLESVSQFMVSWSQQLKQQFQTQSWPFCVM